MSVTIAPAGKDSVGNPLPVLEGRTAPNPIQQEIDSGVSRARAERMRAQSERTEVERIAALQPLRLAELVAPDLPSVALDRLGTYVAEVKLLADRMRRGVEPAGESDTRPIEADVQVVLGPDGKPDLGATVDATRERYVARLADAASRPRPVAVPRWTPNMAARMRLRHALDTASQAFEKFSASLSEAHRVLGAEVESYRGEVERYHADVGTAKREFEAAQQATIERAAQAERDELERTVRDEQDRQEKLRRAKALGVGGEHV